MNEVEEIERPKCVLCKKGSVHGGQWEVYVWRQTKGARGLMLHVECYEAALRDRKNK
jgi:hypothetical protein